MIHNKPKKILTYSASILIACILAWAIFCMPAKAEWGDRMLGISLDQKDGVGTYYLKNKGMVDLTVTIWLKDLENARPGIRMPHTLVLRPGERREVVKVYHVNRKLRWYYMLMYCWRFGDKDAAHDDSVTYRLPYRSGETFRIIQGYDGDFSHHGEYRYSTDWDMPDNTPILASRDGVVFDVEDSFEGRGLTEEYRNRTNYIKIRHSDGTIGTYAHIRKGGAAVRTGQKIRAGDLIGYSGDVGYSGGYHLHFDVCVPENGMKIRTIPVRFRTEEGERIILESGKTYRAP